MSERNEFDDQPSMYDAQEDCPCGIGVENDRVESVFHRRVSRGWKGK